MCLGPAALIIISWVPRQIWAGDSQPNQSPVAEIRFGIIEPPVVAQKDITVRAATSNQMLEQKPLECSGLAWYDGNLIISSDRHQHMIFTCKLDLNEMAIGTAQPHIIIGSEQYLLDDAECITLRQQPNAAPRVYVMCSLSNDLAERTLPMRRHMLCFTLDQIEPFTFHNPKVFNAGTIREALNVHFKEMGVPPYRTFYGDFIGAEKNTYRWGNVEGIAFTPQGPFLMCGMRNPLYEKSAMMFVVSGINEAFDVKDPSRLKVIDLFLLDLGERGVSDLCWDPVSKGYLITAAKSNGPKLDKDQPFPPNTLDGALFWWSGRKTEKPILIARAPDMKIEAVCRLGTSRFIAIGSDEGDVSEGREQRQSVLTIMDFTGVKH
jgi:hypothetical protein